MVTTELVLLEAAFSRTTARVMELVILVMSVILESQEVFTRSTI